MYQGKYVQETPVRQRPRRKQRSRKGTIAFYSVYLVFIALFFVCMVFAMNALRDWLVKFEASQPSHQSDKIYQELFGEPDWAALYTMAGMEDTAFEDKNTYAAYMKARTEGKTLQFLETSAGLSGDHKYIIRLEGEKIASFTLSDKHDGKESIPEWEMTDFALFFERTHSVTVQRIPGYTVCINGKPLDDRYTIRKVSTVAEDYLPEGIHGYQLEEQQLTGLLMAPTVTLVDDAGNSIPLTADPQTGVYTLAIQPQEITEEAKQLALTATKAYALCMIGQGSKWDLVAYYSKDSQFYQSLLETPLGWTQSGASHAFTEPVYSDYYRYSDTLFSIKIAMTLKQTRTNGTVKEYVLDNTMFFRKEDSGKWMVMEATNIDVQVLRETVRLSFMQDGAQLASYMVNTDGDKLTLPQVTPPQGYVFKGWVRQESDEKGNIVLTVIFDETQSGEITVTDGNNLEPMVLQPHFEKEGA